MTDKIRDEINTLLDGSRDAIVCSIDADGNPNAKAMFVSKHEDLHTFWFSTNTSSRRVRQWQENPAACVYLNDPRLISGLMLIGRMEIYTDEKTKRAFWREGDEQYYTLGPTDPDYCMAKFIAAKGNYYHNLTNENFTVTAPA